ncbi:OmpP1/FadL family transporter [Roseicella aerolata]|uniref:Outer membrane protein transport protein n=1 Tax=Roseicella aerolata TaxID=2883479 RepID=A0A9X1IIQ3_9PROT|nr:outer membrane protein transport protein [Roseicella aerolata]MCB4824896.1 outer membrane protein transport protein [Roseicella aerolata]
MRIPGVQPICFAFGVLSFAGTAAATGYELREQSAVGQGVSFAGAAARNDDPSMIFFNPAAMASLPGMQGAIVGSGIFPAGEATSGTATRNAALGGSRINGTLGGDIALDAFVPATYATVELAPAWRFGLGITAPWGLVTKSPAESIARYHALTSSLRTVNITPALSWQVLPNLALGAGLQIQYASARLSSGIDFGAIGATQGLAGFVPGTRDGRSTASGTDTALGFQLGAQWEPLIGTRLGLAFRSAVFHEVTGDATFEGVPFPLSLSPSFANTGARSKLVTPETLHLGLSQRIDSRWTLLAGLEWTNWSRFRELVVAFDNGRAPSVTEEKWRDSVFLSIGGEYRWSEALTLRAGFAYDQTPVREADRTPRIPDNDRYWLSVGASYQIHRNVTLSAAYTHIFVDDATVTLRDPGPNNTNLFRGNLDATYRASVDILTAQLRFAF